MSVSTDAPSERNEEPKTCQSAPDTSGVNQAAIDSSKTGADALAWYEGEAARTQGQRDQSAATQEQVAQQQLAMMGQQSSIAADYDNYNKTTFRPLEQSIVSNAQNYDTAGREQAAADSATADVRAAQAGQQTTAAQSLARMGYDPSVNATKMAASSALAQASAATNARRTTEATGRAMMMDAASLGRGLPSAQATAIQTGTNAGNSAVGAAGAANASTMGTAALMGQGYGTAMQGYQVAGNLYGQQAQLQQTDNSGAMGLFGSVLGAGIMKYSSKALKVRRTAMPDGVALNAVVAAHGTAGHRAPLALPAAPRVSKAPRRGRVAAMGKMRNDVWTYNPGVADGGTHVGPYAEEAHAHLGADIAPHGRMINMERSAHANGDAIAELHGRVQKLTKLLEAHA